MARFAPGERFDGDGLFNAGEGFLEAQLEIVAQVRAAGRILARAAGVHELAENRRENVGKAVEVRFAERVGAAMPVLESGLAEPVIGRALLGILEDVIGLVDGLEAGFGVLAAALAIGMAFLGHPAIGGLDRRFVGASLDAQQIVIVLLDHQ